MITLAYAQSSAQGELGIAQFLPLILMFVVLYFLMIRQAHLGTFLHFELGNLGYSFFFHWIRLFFFQR